MTEKRNILGVPAEMSDNIQKSDKSINEEPISTSKCAEAKDWGKELAHIWQTMSCPSKPSHNELTCYSDLINTHIKKKQKDLKVLILGSTIEFRKWLHELKAKVYICDKSREYYDEINSLELSEIELSQIVNKENLQINFWHEMDCSGDFKNFDVVIGDLAIGNVEPKYLNIFIEKIAESLKPGGIFIGKSLFYYPDKPYCENNLFALCQTYEERSANENEPAYPYFMYQLSLSARNHKNHGKISFKDIRGKIDKLHNDGKISDKTRCCLLKQYCSQSKLDISFYAYDFVSFNNNMKDTGKFNKLTAKLKSGDIYEDDFSIFAYQKESTETIENYVNEKIKDRIYELIDEQQYNTIQKQYYILSLIQAGKLNKQEVFERKDIYPPIKEKMYKVFTAKVDENYNFLCSYVDETIEKEDVEVSKGIQNSDRKGAETYANAMAYFVLKKIKGVEGEVQEALWRTIFKNNTAGYWQPRKQFWLTARVLLCLDISEKTENDYRTTNKDDIKEVLKHIIREYKSENGGWTSGTENNRVTIEESNALCLDALLMGFRLCCVNNESTTKQQIEDTIKNINVLYRNKRPEMLNNLKRGLNKPNFNLNNVFPHALSLTAMLKILNFNRENNREDYSDMEYYELLSALKVFVMKFTSAVAQNALISDTPQNAAESKLLHSILYAINCENSNT